jgi:hypothetical protein
VKYWYLFFLLAISLTAKAQFPVTAHVTGSVRFADSSKDYISIKIFNKRMDDFVRPNRDGTFELFGFKSDTFIFLCQGYELEELSYKDSIRKMEYEAHILLHRPVVNLKTVVIVPPKTIDQIQHEIDNLGVPNTDTYQTVDPQNALTALWEMFSKQEKEKRKLAELEDNDMRRKVMRELLRICVKDHLIDLRYSQMDAFIDYCGYSDSYLKQVTMYDLLSSIKVNYHYFSGERQ